MYSKKPAPKAPNPQINQLSLDLKNKTEILQIKSARSTSSEFQKPEIYKPDSTPKSKERSKVTIGAFDEEAISSVIAEDKGNEKPVIQGEKIEIEAQQTNPISEVIKELTIDLRHEKLIGNADWSESSTIDLEHFNYSADYSAFLSSYE
ncbi:MAG: hypothetical protein ACFBSE_02310 [Prochloraceae cyanobacterium]